MIKLSWLIDIIFIKACGYWVDATITGKIKFSEIWKAYLIRVKAHVYEFTLVGTNSKSYYRAYRNACQLPAGPKLGGTSRSYGRGLAYVIQLLVE